MKHMQDIGFAETLNIIRNIDTNDYIVKFRPSTVYGFGHGCLYLEHPDNVGIQCIHRILLSIRPGEEARVENLQDSGKHILTDDERSDLYKLLMPIFKAECLKVEAWN